MRKVAVYRLDYGMKTKDHIGSVLEMRKKERARNYHDLLRLVRKLFSVDTADALHITIDASQARGTILPERTRDVAAG